jgi:hypothetical protein
MVSCRCAFNFKNGEHEEYYNYGGIYILNIWHKICKKNKFQTESHMRRYFARATNWTQSREILHGRHIYTVTINEQKE